MGSRTPYKSVLVMGIESWSLPKLLDRMYEVCEYNVQHGIESMEQCPRHWRSYCEALEAEWRRRGQPQKLF